MPDSIEAITDSLPIIGQREAFIIGDSISMPSLVLVDKVEDKPDSKDIDFHSEWKKDWVNVVIKKVVESFTN